MQGHSQMSKYQAFVDRMFPGSQFVPVNGDLVGVATVAPAAAAAVLKDHNRDNRPRNPTMVRRLARNMADGVFLLNGDTVVFDDNLNLRNGQTRMAACVEAGVQFETYCVVGRPAAGYITHDQHGKRSTTHIFTQQGRKHPDTLAAAVTHLHGFFLNGSLGPVSSKYLLTIWDDEAMLRDHPQLERSVAYIHSIRLTGSAAGKVGGTGLTSASHYLFSRVHRDKADEMYAAMANLTVPVGSAYDPLRRLLQMLMHNYANGMPVRRFGLGAMTVKGWNAFYTGRGGKALAFRDDEPYPLVAGWKYDDNALPVSPVCDGEG